MSLSYHFTFSAPATVAADELLEFLETVETEAKQMGFKPTMVLEAVFDTPERREFARRVVRAIHIEDERLQGVVLPVPEQVRDFSPNTGHCRLEPERAVILVVTDEVPGHVLAVQSAMRRAQRARCEEFGARRLEHGASRLACKSTNTVNRRSANEINLFFILPNS